MVASFLVQVEAKIVLFDYILLDDSMGCSPQRQERLEAGLDWLMNVSTGVVLCVIERRQRWPSREVARPTLDSTPHHGCLSTQQPTLPCVMGGTSGDLYLLVTRQHAE